MSRFAGRTAIVTGAGAGIGAAAARALGAEGAAVGVLDRDGDRADATVRDIVAAGGEALALAADVTSAAQVREAVDATARAFDGVDLLFGNAGINHYNTVPDCPEDEWDAIVDTNLKAAYLLCHDVIPRMRERGGGAIVLTASVQAFASQRTVAAYSASKGGIVALTRTLALDHAGEGIRVNAIAPGSVRTPMLRASADHFVPEDPEGAMDEWGRLHPIGRLIEPEEVANLVLFLLSDDASAMTGGTHLVDGGLLAKLGV